MTTLLIDTPPKVGGTTIGTAAGANVTSQLMTNHAAARPVDARNTFAVAEDSSGNPMVFAIGTDGVLRLLTVAGLTGAGWIETDLSSALGAGMIVTTFAISQSPNGTITLGLAAAVSTAATATTMYVSPPLPNDPHAFDWTTAGSKLVARPWATGPIEITDILIGGDDNNGLPLVIAVAESAGKVGRYQVNPNTGDSSWMWTPFVFPDSVNLDGMRAMAVGQVFGDQGVFALYDVGSDQRLEFTSLPDPKFHKTSNYAFTIPSGMTSIDVVPGSGNSSDLFVAGAGVLLFSASGSASSVVCTPAQAGNITRLVTRSDGTTTSVWAIAGDEHALYTSRSAGQWRAPIPLRDSTTQIAAMRSRVRRNNQVFFVTGDQRLGYFWQDPKTSMWTETIVPLADTGSAITYDTYTTRIAVTDAAANPALFQTLQLATSQLTYLTVNGVSHLTGPDAAASVTTDESGCITVVTPTATISSGILHLSGVGDAVIDINPAASVLNGLGAITKGDDLKAAVFTSGPKSGQPVLANPPPDQTLDAAASAVSRLIGMSSTLPADGSPTAAIHARTRAADAPALTLASPVAAGDAWGMTLGAQPAYLDGSAASSMLGSLGDTIDAAAGDVLHWIENAGAAVESFFIEGVEDAWRFVVQIAGEVFEFVLDALEHVASALNWVLKNVLGIDLAAIIQWLGFLFDWDDIKLTHKVLVNMANHSVDFGEAALAALATKVTNGFEWLKQQVATMEPPGHANDQVRSTGANQQSSLSATQSRFVGAAHTDPSADWGRYHMVHGGGLDMTPPRQQPTDPMTAFYTDIIEPTIASMMETFQNIGSDISAGFNGDMTVAQMFQALGADALIGVLDALEKVVVGIIEFIEDLVEMLRQGANAVIDVPFFSALYREIADADLTILDLIALIVAIPATIGYKLLTGEAPFATGTDGLDDPSTTWQEAFALLGADTSVPAPAPVAAGGAPVAAGGAPVAFREMAVVADPPVATAFAAVSTDADSGANGSGGPGGGSPAKSTTSTAAKQYSYWGGAIATIAGGVDDVLGILQAKAAIAAAAGDFDKQEAETGKISTLEFIRFGLTVIHAAGAFPVGDDEEVSLQRSAWGIEFGVGALELLVLLVAQKREGSTPADIQKAVKVNGVITIVEGIVLFALEVAIFAEEMQQTEGKSSNVLKFFQNLCYLAARLGIGAGQVIPPESVEAQGVAGVAAACGLGFGLVFNLVVLLLNATNDLEHQSY